MNTAFLLEQQVIRLSKSTVGRSRFLFAVGDDTINIEIGHKLYCTWQMLVAILAGAGLLVRQSLRCEDKSSLE